MILKTTWTLQPLWKRGILKKICNFSYNINIIDEI